MPILDELNVRYGARGTRMLMRSIKKNLDDKTGVVESIAGRIHSDLSSATQADLDQIKSGGVDDADIMYVLQCLLGLLTVAFGLQQMIVWLTGKESSAPDIWTDTYDQTRFQMRGPATNLLVALFSAMNIDPALALRELGIAPQPYLIQSFDNRAVTPWARQYIIQKVSVMTAQDRDDLIGEIFRDIEADKLHYMMLKALTYPNERLFNTSLHDVMIRIMNKDTFANVLLGVEDEPGNLISPPSIPPDNMTQAQIAFANGLLKSIHEEYVINQGQPLENIVQFKAVWAYEDTPQTRFDTWKYWVNTPHSVFSWHEDKCMDVFARAHNKRIVIHKGDHIANVVRQPETFGHNNDEIHLLETLGDYSVLVPVKAGGSNIFREEMGDLVDTIKVCYSHQSSKLMKLVTDLYPTVTSSMRVGAISTSIKPANWSLKQVMVFLYVAIALGIIDNSQVRSALT